MEKLHIMLTQICNIFGGKVILSAVIYFKGLYKFRLQIVLSR